MSVPWDLAVSVMRRMIREGIKLVGHFFITADRPIIEKELGVEIPIEQVDDSVIRHYLLNASLCSIPKTGDDAEDNRGVGYMDLYSVASLWTELPNWKRCRGSKCVGPCPNHDFTGYNGVDAAAVDIAYPRQIAAQKRKNIPDSLVEHTKRLMIVYERMKQQGVKIDVEYIKKLEAEAEERKNAIFSKGKKVLEKPCGTCRRMKIPPCKKCTKAGFKKGEQGIRSKEVEAWLAPFNPKSPQATLGWFHEKGVWLPSTDKDSVRQALEREQKKSNRQEIVEWLQRLYDFKDLGKGLKSWFDAKYIDAFDLAHPRFIAPATATGRSASSGPNFQNVPKRGFGKLVRAGIIPRSPDLVFARADYKQLELRMCLWESGVDSNLGYDAFNWLVSSAPDLFEQAASISPMSQKPRDVAKRVSHAFDYLEGLVVLYPEDLRDPRTTQAIRDGWLKAYKDWEFAGGIVAFTGVNLARSLFGKAGRKERKMALDIQETYSSKFPSLRKWHRRVTEQVERGYVQSRWTGRYLELWGPPGSASASEAAKAGASFFGQGQSADYAQEAILLYDEIGETPLLFVHDELDFELPRNWSDSQYVEFMKVMEHTSKRLEGFKCPIDIEVGPNWFDLRSIEQ